jgi:hypothetical protein
MTTEERSAWARYMLQHQRRFWDGRTLPRKPVRTRVTEAVSASPGDETRAVSAPARREPVPPQIPVIVIPRRTAVMEPVMRPGVRYNI